MWIHVFVIWKYLQSNSGKIGRVLGWLSQSMGLKSMGVLSSTEVMISGS